MQMFETPAFVINEKILRSNLEKLKEIKDKSGCEILYATKPLIEPTVLQIIDQYLDGFSTSSLFEARLVCEQVTSYKKPVIDRTRVHIVTPSLKDSEIDQISDYAHTIVFNSITQAKRLHPLIRNAYNPGLRINPELSFVSESRYDPCKLNSKLGATITQVKKNLDSLGHIKGVHFHNNCEGTNAHDLLSTVEKITHGLKGWLVDLDWINLGGGYFLNNMDDLDPLYKAIDMLQRLGLSVIMEPGGSVVGSAGEIWATVTDIFENNGQRIAIIDASTNHIPEVLEYNYKAPIAEATGGDYKFLIAGPTCLAGDEFGIYSFDKPLEIGSPLTFKNVGSYTMAKAHHFNGINIPSNNILTKEGNLFTTKEFSYQHYKSRWA